MIRVSRVGTGECVARVKAHSAEITDVSIHETATYTLIASSSRDRTIQLLVWSSGQLDLVQTLDEHAGSVTCISFAKEGKQLLSCSADRTIVAREAIIQDDGVPPLFVITRTITLKNSPTCMRMALFDDTVLISATDRTISQVGTRFGRVNSTFKASDTDGGDAVIMSSLVHLPSTAGSPIIAGVASDKSIRMYADDGTLLARDWGHTEGVTDIALLKSHTAPDELAAMKLVTVAADGTIFIWATVPERPRSRDSSDYAGLSASSLASNTPGIVSAEQPLRKVISQSELARFQRSRSTETDGNAQISPTSPSAITASSAATATNLTSSGGKLKKKPSRLSIRPPPTRLESSPLGSIRNGASSTATASRSNNNDRHHHNRLERSPSPTPPSPSRRGPLSPRTSMVRSGALVAPGRHRLSTGAVPPPLVTAAVVTSGNTVSTSTEVKDGSDDVATTTEQLCQILKVYRQKLDDGNENTAAKTPSSSSSNDTLSSMHSLEKELIATLQRLRKTPTPAFEKEEEEIKEKDAYTATANPTAAATTTTASSNVDATTTRTIGDIGLDGALSKRRTITSSSL
jgi:WD40 repeat protein